MANWKKVVVSGSNVSQLNNDAGYLTAGTITQANGFATASFDGTNLLADSITGSLNFASSSTQGLTISANAGTDTLTFGLAAIPNSSLANSAITIAGTSTSLGGSITAATILSGTGTVSGSSQISYSGITGVPAGIVSGSTQVAALLPAGTVSGSSQVSFSGITGVPAGLVSGSSQISYSGITGVPANIVSASVLSSPGQGQALLTTNGVAGSTIDLGLETGDSPTFAGVTAGNITVGVTNDNTIGVTGDLSIDTSGGTVTINDNLVVTNNLTVQGTASFQNTTNLEVADRFILMASGSNTTGDGGIVVQQGTQNIGEAFAWDSGVSRWGVTGSFTANNASYTPDAFMAAVTTAAGTSPAPASRYNAVGNIYVSSGDESIWIYS
jgi:hypothetical protein